MVKGAGGLPGAYPPVADAGLGVHPPAAHASEHRLTLAVKLRHRDSPVGAKTSADPAHPQRRYGQHASGRARRYLSFGGRPSRMAATESVNLDEARSRVTY